MPLEPRHSAYSSHKSNRELRAYVCYAIVSLVFAIGVAILGFGSIAVAAAGIANILVYIFLILFVVSLIMHFARGSATV